MKMLLQQTNPEHGIMEWSEIGITDDIDIGKILSRISRSSIHKNTCAVRIIKINGEITDLDFRYRIITNQNKMIEITQKDLVKELKWGRIEKFIDLFSLTECFSSLVSEKIKFFEIDRYIESYQTGMNRLLMPEKFFINPNLFGEDRLSLIGIRPYHIEYDHMKTFQIGFIIGGEKPFIYSKRTDYYLFTDDSIDRIMPCKDHLNVGKIIDLRPPKSECEPVQENFKKVVEILPIQSN